MQLREVSISEQKQVRGQSFPMVLSPEKACDREEFYSYLADNFEFLKSTLAKRGAVLFRGCPVDSAEDFEKMLDKAQFENAPYVGGAAPREAVTKSRILTANDSPPHEKIPFHHEMSQVPKPPKYIFFYCDIPASKGGETSIVDSNEVYNEFVSIDASFAKEVEEKGIRYVRVMPKENDKSSPIGRSWKSTFMAETREQAEEKMKEQGMNWTWLDNDDLITETATLPAIKVYEEEQRPTFFNSMVAAYIGWEDVRNDRKKAVKLGDGDSVKGDVLEKVAVAMDEKSVNFKWAKGDVLWLDNRQVMHARRPFEGERRILASIASN